MQEREVTIAGQHRPLPAPFHVLATQNPIEQEGTYPLPEAQLDRFLVQIDVPYPDRETERGILVATTGIDERRAHQVFDPEALIAAQRIVRRMPVGEAVVEAILDLVRACRPDGRRGARDRAERRRLGPGTPRGAGAHADGARARAARRPARALGRGRGGAGATGARSPHGIELRARAPRAWTSGRSSARSRRASPGSRPRLEPSGAPYARVTSARVPRRIAAPLPALMADAQHLAATVLLGVHGRKRAGTGDEFWQYRPAEAGDSLRPSTGDGPPGRTGISSARPNGRRRNR
jgi:hypothetical protein